MGMLKFPICIFVLSSLLSSCISQISPSEQRCSGRKILTSNNGKISDGLDNYTQYSRCEWLIDAGSSEKFILLEFSFMQTECSYDFVMVYDGNSFKSTLLATVSGDTKPRPIVAKSGYMLIYLFSDRNYNLGGFIANYSIQDCPNLCYNRGRCVNHICVCDTGFTGEACENHICPDSCHSHGQCDLNGCHCDKGYIGDSCNFKVDGDRYDNRWYNLSHSSQNFTARFGHSGSYIKNVNCIYAYGGFNLNHILDDIVIYCLDNSTWDIAIKTNPWPLGRKNHATATVADGFFIFGGVLVDGSYSNDLWFYNVSSRIWAEKAKNSSVQPERIMDHTLTFADGWLYLIGGKTEQGFFSSNIYRIDIKECETWEKLRVSGDSRHSRMLSAHTAVFHSVADTIIIYGGYQSAYPKYVELSGKIYAFSIRFHVWSEINNRQVENHRYDRIHNHVKRAHHTSVIIGNYMVVYGGNIHIHKDIETCYDNGTYLYHLGCHQWVTHPLFFEMSTPAERRFGHVSVLAYGNTMFVVGGYSGSVLGDVAAFKFPPTIAPPESELPVEKNYCRAYTDPGGSGAQSCIDDIECALCTSLKNTTRTGCVHRESVMEMCAVSTGNVATPCPGICSSLTSCEACLSHGQEVTMTTTSANTRYYQEECSWCVKNATCQNRWEPDPDGLCDGTSVKGWWEGTSQSWTSIDQCTNNDIRAGIQMIYYYSPQNLLQPDQVLYLASSDIRVEDILSLRGNLKETSKQIIVRITGYIHPLNASLVDGTSDLQLYLKGSGGLMATLNLSTDSSVKNQEIVIEKSSYKMESVSKKANRMSKLPIFRNRGRGYKYYMAIEAGKAVKSLPGSLILEWNIDVEQDDNVISLHPITIAFLEPYNSVHCTIHSNCLACMTDASCAWCSSSLECLYKGDNSTNCSEMYAVTQPSQCDLCQNYPDCVSCVSDQICEWSPGKEKCIRRGRYLQTSRLISECPLPCYKRNNCSICVDDLRDECFWCENTQECFPFAHYISQHISGQCQEWVDSDDVEKKRTCRDCSIFKSCNDCLSRYGCGWCGNIDNRMIGKCVDGDFSGPAHNMNCSVIVAKEGKDKNITVDDPAAWMYDKCLDVDECAHDVDNCDENSSCENTETSYICKCNKGFIQAGYECYKTCYHDCVHGKCNASYECDCNLGYTGPDCGTDCQCNHQSTCSRGVGICDACQNNTGGSNCQYCLPGYYGNSSKGCIACQCNNHEEMTRGHCNNETGKCYCTDNTVGEHCEHCQYGYYGDPSNGGKCYRNCDNRVVINQTMGSLGSFKGSGVTDTHIHCLWIISDGDIHKIENEGVYDTTAVTFTIDDIATECGKEHVYVYEGIPSFVYGTTPGKDSGLLASFCGTKSPVSVTARSKTITVYFEMEVNDHPIVKLFRDFTHQAALAGKTFWIDSIEAVTPGFNGSYEVNNCGESCSFLPNRVCQGQKCVCDAGYTGDNCQDFMCADRCVFHKNNQTCQCETTLGPVGILPWSRVFWPQGGLQGHISKSRYGHTLVYCGSDSLYMFGGYSLRHGLLNDMWKYNMTTSTWTTIVAVTTTEPKGRYYHTAVCLPYLQNIYVFGGFIQEKGDLVKATNEMWKFGIGTRKWTLEVPPEVNAVAGHTMTKIGDTKLLVIGGFSRQNYFSEWMYEYDAAISSWKKYDQHTPLIGAPVGIYGHTAVYHELTETVYIYGGMLLKHDNPVVSDELFALDLNDEQWNNLQSDEGSQKDKRIFHTAVDVGEYMVIFGGQFTEHDHIRDHVLVYHYQCNFWNQFKFLDTQTQKSINVMVSAASVAIGTNVYIIGGYNGQDYGEMIKLSLPEDRCHMIKDVTCKTSSGCKAVVVPGSDEKNISSCFSSDRASPDEAVQIVGGPQCDEQWHQTRHCEQYTDCGSCLAVFPQFNKSRPTCQWCSNCLESKCIKFGLTCPDNDNCNPDETSTKFRVEHCPDFTCRAGTCERCNKLGKCAWGRPFMTELAENGGTKKETLGWSCIDRLACINNSCSYNQCPAPCHTAVDCRSCLSKRSTISGSMECTWSNKLQECMSPEYKNLCCSTGNCGLLINSFENHCPKQCHEFSRCSECLMAPQCGWCAYGLQNGLGICIPGGIKGPTVGKCEVGDIRNSESDIMNRYHHYKTAEPTWSYIDCPPENECLNDHHNCNLRTQKCVDTQEGYDCLCKKGYIQDTGEKKCIPVCHEGCEHGTCVLPDVCRCNFGYVGNNCTVECKCHKHSNCESENRRDNCSLCHNNTQGDHCEHCKLWYVGNPKNEVPCVPCFNVCNNHTTKCSSVKDFARLDPAVTYTTYEYEKVIPNFSPNGPNGNPVCIRCQNNTEGRLCDVCQNGYFRLKSEGKTLYDACIKCQCHGHSNTCDNTTGKCHYCANNTETRCNSDDKGSPDKCWEKQCSSCKEYFQGNPVNNHQCYRQMTLEKEYCLDPSTQNDCNQNPGPLMQGRTVFYAVHPRYLNVDIRITIDVLKGGADVFFSSSEKTFTVKVNKDNGVHILELDDDLHIKSGSSQKWSYPMNKRSLDNYNIHIHNIMADLAEAKALDKRSVQNSSSGVVYELVEINAENFHTYHTVTKTKTILRVKTVESRLVITIPVHSHNLRLAKFYIIMYGVGGKNSNHTYGNLYFRQDQPHIDLFVFFSVFFSSFFLFLAVCVLLWKMKQAVDTQRSRQQRAKEMMHMASRPFSKVLVYIEPEPIIMSSTPILRRQKLSKLPHRNVPIMGLPPVEILPPIIHTLTTKEIVPFDVTPIAMEPIINGSAVIRTVVIQLPGGPLATSKLCLGSTLTTNYRAANNNPKSNTRRRPSTTAC